VAGSADCVARRGRPTHGQPLGARNAARRGDLSLVGNLYLHWFEHRFYRSDGPGTWAKARLVRYADDFVILARCQGRELRYWVERELEGRFQLQINRDKTRVVNLKEPGACVSFLGFSFRYDRDLKGRDHRYLNVFPSDKSLVRVRTKLREFLHRKRVAPVPRLIAEVNRSLAGWSRYFSHGYPRQAFRKVNQYLIQSFMRHLHRRSQRPYRSRGGRSFYAHLQCLGLRLL
jgi:RNA-directed DNA polymerase